MKIGLLLTIYNCDKYVEECLDPWFELKKDHDIIISAVSGMFVEYKAIGLPNRNKKTLEKLLNYDIDFQITTKGDDLLYEDESRNLCLDFLNKKNCDLIWVIDGDETYTKEQILGIINFIENNKEYDWYEIQFKNLTIRENLFMSYVHGRIMWANRYGGISYFYFDNKFIYNDPNAHINIKSIKIPKKIAYIKHYSWLSDDSRTKDKLLYQNIRYKNKYVNGGFEEVEENLRCSYVWNNDKNRLDFNESFYNFFEEEIPCLHEEVSCFSYDFDINYSRTDKYFNIINVQKNMDVYFEIYDNFNTIIYNTQISLSIGINYYIAPNNKNNIKYRIKAYVDDCLIHDEKIHLTLTSNKKSNVNLIISSAHIEDSSIDLENLNKRTKDYILSFDNIRKVKDIFNNITIVETRSKDKITYLEDSGFNVYYSELHNNSINKGINWMKHIENFIRNIDINDINIYISGRYLLQMDNSIIKIINDYMINDNYEFVAKNAGDIYDGVYDGKLVHTFLIFFKKEKFLEFVSFQENIGSESESIEYYVNEFLKVSDKCKILPKEYYLGVKTNYYHEKNQFII